MALACMGSSAATHTMPRMSSRRCKFTDTERERKGIAAAMRTACGSLEAAGSSLMGSCPLSYSRRMSRTFLLSSLQSVNSPGTCTRG